MAKDTITLGGGCFWCLEAVYLIMEGVEHVESGYTGGTVANPSYEQVCTGCTGHAEVVQVTFNTDVTSLDEILAVFFTIHDPTSLNRQGADVGTQYRSAIYHHSEAQRNAAKAMMDRITTEGIWTKPLVTELVPLGDYYKAEDYHQDYYANHPYQGYCRAVVEPKVAKFRKQFAHKLAAVSAA